MTVAERVRMYASYLRTEGFRAEEVGDDEVKFLRDGVTYFIFVDDDEEYFELVLPVLDLEKHQDDPDGLRQAALLANERTRVAKLYIEDTWLVASTQHFCIPPEAFQAVFGRCLVALDEVTRAFNEHMTT